MASLRKPSSCSKCGATIFTHLFHPERWVCLSCNHVEAERPSKPDPNKCRDCDTPRGSKPFKGKKNQCLDCFNRYMQEWRAENPEKWRAWKLKHKKVLQATVRRTMEKSPRAFLTGLFSHTKARATRPSGPDLVAKGKLNPACLNVQIDFDYLWNLWEVQQGRCALTGLYLGHRFNAPLAVSIDRKDSSLGYVPGNVQLVCQWVNKAKGNMANDDFKALLMYTRQNFEFVHSKWSGADLGNPGRPFVPEVAAFMRLVHDRLVEVFWNHPLMIQGEWWVLVVQLTQNSGDLCYFRLAWEDEKGLELSYAGKGAIKIGMESPDAVDEVVGMMAGNIKARRAVV